MTKLKRNINGNYLIYFFKDFLGVFASVHILEKIAVEHSIDASSWDLSCKG